MLLKDNFANANLHPGESLLVLTCWSAAVAGAAKDKYAHERGGLGAGTSLILQYVIKQASPATFMTDM